MEAIFGKYLEAGTRRILEIMSSSDMGEEEKGLIIETFASELSNNIGSTENLGEYEPLLYGVSVGYIDGKISLFLSNQNATNSDYETAIRLCQRQQEILGIFQSNKWKLPKINNTDIEKCLEELRWRQESISISSKILKEDRQIDELNRSAQTDLSVRTCDMVLELITELEKDIALCKTRKMTVPEIGNKDTKKTRKKITDLRKIAEQKDNLHQSIYDIDLQIHNLVSIQNATLQQWQEIISLCQRQSELLLGCNKKQWPSPSVRYVDPRGVADKYRHYLEMVDLDRVLVSDRDSLSTSKQYKTFFVNCDKQRGNIEICKKNRWEIPALDISDPAGLSNAVHAEKSKRDKAKTLKKTLVLAGIIAFCTLILVLFGIYKYREGKAQVPFDSLYVTGKDLDEIYKELDDAGFENITKKPAASGWLDSEEVISVSIDNSENYGKGDYRELDVTVVITYSSKGRVYVTDLLKDWKKTDYATIEKIFKDAGFTNVSLEELITSDKDNDKLTAALSLNGEMYINEHCYLPKNAPIIISYYALKIGIGNDSSQFIGLDYEDVVKDLKESGFTNVQTQVVNTGWEKGNTVVGVTVNNKDTYSSSESFDPDVKIVVKYSSNDRIDATAILGDWATKDYLQLRNSLSNKGFTNIAVVPKDITDGSKNHLVAGIAINHDSFASGDCFIQKDKPITIEYYVLVITIGNNASAFEGEQYSTVVANLKNIGFTNIQLQRANNLINGWITKEGSIKSISIGGNSDFTDTSIFQYDTQIVIVVNTFRDKGCEDIIIIAD